MSMIQDNPIRPALLVSGPGLIYYQGVITHLERTLKRAGSSSRVVICSPADTGPSLDIHPDWLSYPEFDLPLMQGLNIRRLQAQLQAFDPTVIHCIEESCLGLGQMLASALDLNVMVNIQCLQMRRSQLTISSRRCQGLLVPCDSIRASVLRLHPRYSDRVMRITPWLDMPADPHPQDETDRHVPTWVVTARRSRDKEVGLLMECLGRLKRMGHAFMVAMFVEMEAEGKIRHWIEQHQLYEEVTLVTDLYRWPEVVAASDAMIVPEPLLVYDPRLMEAMCQGLTVIACDGGVDDWLESGVTGWTFKRGDQNAMMDTMQYLLNRRTQAHALGMAAQERMHQLALQAQVNDDSWLQLYQQMATPSTGLEVLVS